MGSIYDARLVEGMAAMEARLLSNFKAMMTPSPGAPLVGENNTYPHHSNINDNFVPSSPTSINLFATSTDFFANEFTSSAASTPAVHNLGDDAKEQLYDHHHKVDQAIIIIEAENDLSHADSSFAVAVVRVDEPVQSSSYSPFSSSSSSSSSLAPPLTISASPPPDLPPISAFPSTLAKSSSLRAKLAHTFNELASAIESGSSLSLKPTDIRAAQQRLNAAVTRHDTIPPSIFNNNKLKTDDV